MELAATLDALRHIEGPLTVVSDSTYVVNCFKQGWWKNWLAKDWKNSQRKPVANRDLWEPLIDLYRARGDVAFEWVKGHSGDRWNDYADGLAVRAAAEQSDTSGDTPPALDDLEPDVVGRDVSDGTRDADDSGPARDTRLPHGRLVAVMGHRPTELEGYDARAIHDALRAKIAEVLEAKRVVDADLIVVSGLRQGAEALGALAALDLGIPLVAVLPYPEADARWPADVRAAFAEMVDRAKVVVTLETKQPVSSAAAGQALSRRDGWIRHNVDEAIIVWDGSDGWVEKTWRSFEDQLDADVWMIDPHSLR